METPAPLLYGESVMLAGPTTIRADARPRVHPPPGCPEAPQSTLVDSFCRCFLSQTIFISERRMGTAMGRKSGM